MKRRDPRFYWWGSINADVFSIVCTYVVLWRPLGGMHAPRWFRWGLSVLFQYLLARDLYAYSKTVGEGQ